MLYLNCQDMCSDSSNQMKSLAGSVFKTEEDHLKIWKLQFFLVLMPTHYLIYGNLCLEINKLKIQPTGMATFKKIINLLFLQFNRTFSFVTFSWDWISTLLLLPDLIQSHCQWPTSVEAVWQQLLEQLLTVSAIVRQTPSP